MKLIDLSSKKYEKMDDDEIAVLAKDDNMAAEYLIVRYKSIVKACAKPYYFVGADRDDVIQEGMIALIRAINSYNPAHTHFRNFAKMCIKRRIISAIKASNRIKHMPLNHSYSLDKPMDDSDSNNRTLLDVIYTSSDNDPLSEVINKESFSFFEKTLEEELTKLEKRVLSLYIEGFSYVDISARLGTTYKSVDSAVTRIKRKIRNVSNMLCTN